jgi:hypothetical protein
MREPGGAGGHRYRSAMAGSGEGRRNVAVLAAVVAAPLVVAVVLAAVVLSSRDKPEPKAKAAAKPTSVTEGTAPLIPGASVPPGDYGAFCRTTLPIRNNLATFIPTDGEEVSPGDVADALASVDMSTIDTGDLPPAVRKAVGLATVQQDAVVASIRALPPGARPEEAKLPPGWLKGIGLLLSAYSQKCEDS